VVEVGTATTRELVDLWIRYRLTHEVARNEMDENIIIWLNKDVIWTAHFLHEFFIPGFGRSCLSGVDTQQFQKDRWSETYYVGTKLLCSRMLISLPSDGR
jgi:hypothetical protein